MPNVAYDATTNSDNLGAASTFSLTHNATVTNGMLIVVGVFLSQGNKTVSSMTCNNVAMTFLRRDIITTDYRIEFWYGTKAVQTSNTVAGILSGAPNNFIVLISTFSGVNLESPIDASNSANDTIGTNPSISLTTVNPGAMIIDYCLISDYTATTLTPNSSQSQILINTDTNPLCFASYQGPVSPAGSTSDGWTFTAPGPSWVLTAVSIKPHIAPIITGVSTITV